MSNDIVKFPKKGDKVATVLGTVNAIDAIAYSGKLDKTSKKPVYKRIDAVYLDGTVKDEAGDIWKVVPSDQQGVWKAVS